MYESQLLPVRDEVEAGHQAALKVFSQPGTWFRADQRYAILEEARNAERCALCADRKSALSPYLVEGEHDSLGDLPENIVEVIHRLQTDSGRLTERWFNSVMESGLSREEYIEVVGLVAISIVLDSYAIGLGLDPAIPEDPEDARAEPSRENNPDVVDGGAWVPLMAAPDAEGVVGLPIVPNIARAMGLVPLAIQQFFSLMQSHYNLTDLDFEISRSQVELVAARVSSFNDCFY